MGGGEQESHDHTEWSNISIHREIHLETQKVREGGRGEGDQKAMIALNEVSIHIGQCLGAMLGRWGQGGWPESHDHTEQGQHPHWATVGGRGGGWGWRDDQKAMIALNKVSIHTGLQLGAEWKGGGTGGTRKP